MPWRGPKEPGDFPSLGYGLVDWLEDHLVIPDGPQVGEPFHLTDEQAELVIRFYALNPKTGRRKYRRGAVRRSKGWGKDPLLSGLAIAEFCGDVVFDGWDTNGEPVGKPWPTPWVQVAGLSEEAADANTYSLVYTMLTDSKLVDELGLDVGLTRIHMKDRKASKIEAVSASAGSREGQRITFATLGETHLWTRSNGGVRLAAVLNRNAAKMGGSTFESTNAHVPGENSVAEKTYQSANARTDGVFYDAVEGPAVTDDEIRSGTKKVREAVKVAYGQSSWVDVDRLVLEGKDPSVDLADFRRFYLSQLVKGERKAVDPKQWAGLHADRVVPEKAHIGVGFDGSISGDCTALVGCTEDGHLFTIKVWERPKDAPKDWRVPRGEVHETVAATFERYDVGAMFCDPPKWWSEIDVWAEAYGEERVIAFDTRLSRMPKAVDRFLTAVREASISHDGSRVLTEHVVAADLVKARDKDPDDDTRTLYHLTKGDDGRKIDTAVAAVLALEAAQTMDPATVHNQPFVVF